MHLDSRCDGQMLEGACVSYGRAAKADEIIERDGITIAEMTRDGKLKVKQHPAVAVSNAAWRQVRSFCSEFGLSPVSRTRLTPEKPDSSDVDLFALLSQPRERKPSLD